MNDAIADRIKTFFNREEFPAKALLIKEGTMAKKLFFIDEGCCRCWFNNDGKDVTFQFLFDRNFVSSFETVIAGSPSWYSIETLEPTVAYSITIEEFKQRREANPHIQ